MNRKILVIDDDPAITTLFQPTLGVNFEVSIAKNFDEAITTVKSTNKEFAVVFVDFNLSEGKNGIETAAEIKELFPNTKFVFMTGERLNIKEVIEVIGPEFLFIEKPFNLEEIKQQSETLCLSWNRQNEGEIAKKALEKQKDLIVNSSRDGIMEVCLSRDGIIIHGNQSCYDILGYNEENLRKLFFKNISLYCQNHSTTYKKMLEGGIRKVSEDNFINSDGKLIPVSYTIIPIIKKQGLKNAIIVFQDISEVKEHEKGLEENARYWQNIFDSIEDIIIVFDKNLNIVKMNKTAKSVFPMIIVDEIKYFSITKGRYDTSLETIVLDTFRKKKCHTIDSSMESTFPILDDKYFIVSTYLVKNPAGEKEVILTLRDITQRKNMEDRLRELSIKDSLSGLYNRRYFANALNVEHKRALRSESEYACIMLDLDFFKKINDNYGHEFGDFVIKEFAILMQRELRTTDIVARFGGEEFIILLPDTNLNGCLATANKILKATRNHVFDNGKVSRDDVRVSIGVSSVRASELENCNMIISMADDKLYEAKNAGRDQVKS